MTGDKGNHQGISDWIAASLVLTFAALISLFAIRNNDIWWLLAVGRYMTETGAFIRQDPFTFTVMGSPWSPSSWLGAVIFYGAYKAFAAAGLIVLRVLLVTGIVATTLRTIRSVGVSWALMSPLLVVAILAINTRFIIRAHLFEYLFIALLIGHLLSAHRHSGKRFFVIPIVIQLLWVQMHASYLLGPALVAMYFGGEWLSERLNTNLGVTKVIASLHTWQWKRVAILVGAMFACCLISPTPLALFSQPFASEQRELIARYTLEWRSPFDPAMIGASFHPWFEILLGLAATAIVLSLRRLSLGLVLPVVATAFLALQSHRFRVEFALVAVPIIALQLKQSRILADIVSRISRRMNTRVIAVGMIVIAVGLMASNRDFIEIGETVKARYPERSLEFMVANDIGHRAFNPIGMGSYAVWKLYGQRQTFIDGRNFDPALYRDFIAAQTDIQGMKLVAQRRDLDAFLLPAVEKSDAGMMNLHRWLMADSAWAMVYLDEMAMLYVRIDRVDSEWLEANAFYEYHPLRIGESNIDEQTLQSLLSETKRAAELSPSYTQILLDRSMVLIAVRDHDAAVEVLDQARKLDPDNPSLWNRMGRAALEAERYEDAYAAYGELVRLEPTRALAHINLARAYEAGGKTAQATASFRRAVELSPQDATVYIDFFGMLVRVRYWDDAKRLADSMIVQLPADYRGHYYLAESYRHLGQVTPAMRSAEQAIRLNPQVLGVHMLLVKLYMDAEMYVRALERINSALSLDPTNQIALDIKRQLEDYLNR